MAKATTKVSGINCDVCGKKTTTYVDGKTKTGPWANMCLQCHMNVGCGLGTGLGQKYECQASGEAVKVAG